MEQTNQSGASQSNELNQPHAINANFDQTNQNAYPANASSTVSPSSTPEIRYASFGRRFLAFCVDFLIFSFITFALDIFFFQNQSFSINGFQVQSSVNAISVIVMLLISIVYNLIFLVHYDGATPGKKLLAIKVLQSNGEKVTYPVALIRSMCSLLSSVTLIFFGIGYLWMLWDKKKRTLHDILAGTIVVETNQKPRIGIAIFITSLGCLGILAFFAILAMIVLVVIGSVNKIQESVVKNMSVAKQITIEENKSFTRFDANMLAEDMFKKINEKRQQNNLVAYEQDQRLCAYAQKRLDYLASRGEYDGGQGFYEDTANPQIINAYFRDYSLYATNALNLNLEKTTADELIPYWTGDQESVALSKEFTHSCIKANSQFLVIVLGKKK